MLLQPNTMPLQRLSIRLRVLQYDRDLMQGDRTVAVCSHSAVILILWSDWDKGALPEFRSDRSSALFLGKRSVSS
jgi:hypothetical protein